MVQKLVSLRNLHVFSSVAAAGSISRSAEQLFRAQSAVTRSIHELERELGVTLFERKARGMLLNKYGRQVLLRVRRIEDELRTGQREVVGNYRSPGGDGLSVALTNERRLSALVALTEHHHLGTVALMMGVSRAAISTSIREIESQLNVKLFERLAMGSVPNEQGKRLAFRVRRALFELRVIPEDMAAMQGTMEGTITVGALPLARTTLLPMAIAQLVSAHPKLHVRTVESPYEVLIAQLLAGDVDFVIGALRPMGEGDDLAAETLFAESITIVARREHPLAVKRKVSAKDLHKARWALSRQGSPARNLVYVAFAERGMKLPSPAVETGDLAILRGVLVHSDMITAISPHQVRYEIKDGVLVVLNSELQFPQRKIGITTRTDNLASPGAALLCDVIRSTAKDVISEDADTWTCSG